VKMSKQKRIAECFDYLLDRLWDATTGAALTARGCYRGAVLFAEFLNHELDRRDDLQREGQRATFRRGHTIPDALINAWVINVLDDLRYFRVAAPEALVTVIYRQLGCTHQAPNRKATMGLRGKAVKMMRSGLSLRKIARELKVHPSTVSRWKIGNSDAADDVDFALYHELRELTNVDAFYPMDWKLFRARQDALDE